MKIGATVSAVLLAIAALAVTWWVTTPGSSPAALTAAGGDAVEEPKPSKTGPHPKVVLAEEQYNFGVMKMGDSDKHTFIVRNEGEAPLKLGTPRTTCQCTVSEAAKNAIPPGGEGEITLEWTPSAPTENFDKGAFISTNDPKMPEIRLVVLGRVDPLVVVEPTGTWVAGEVSGDTPIEVIGLIYSRIDENLQITAAESPNPLLTATVSPMSDEKLKEYEAKAGYQINATLSPGIPVGKFSEPLTITTNSKDKEFRKIEMKVTGTRHGPVQVLPTPGTKWTSSNWSLDLRRFPAADGAQATVSMFVSNLPEGETLEFEKIDTPLPQVRLELKRDETFTAPNRQRYELLFRVDPGVAPAMHRGRNAVPVEVTTNHPDAKTMKFHLVFIASP